MSLKIYDVVMYDIVQWVIVVAIVLVSALYMLVKVVPQWRMQLAQRLQQPRYSPWVNQLGNRLGGGSGCGSCDTCGSCATPNRQIKNKIRKKIFSHLAPKQL